MKQKSMACALSSVWRRLVLTPRSQIRLLRVALCLSLAQPLVAVAQANAGPLPPTAQEALDKGIIAARVPDYLLAIRYFEEARKLAPQAPVVFLNLGLAESKIPGRELRAMAWFGAYLSAYPEALNAIAVREHISVLDVRNKINVSRLIRAVQDTVNQLSGELRSDNFKRISYLWARLGDFPAALETTDLVQDTKIKDETLRYIADHQSENGDIVGAQRTAMKIKDVFWQSLVLSSIVVRQARGGDIAGAQKAVELIREGKGQAQGAIAAAQAGRGDFTGAQKITDAIREARSKSIAEASIAEAQAKMGHIESARNTVLSAQKTAELIQDAGEKSNPQAAIATAQAWIGDIADAQKTASLIVNPYSKRRAQNDIARVQQSKANDGILPAIQPKISDWIDKLDDDNSSNSCPLNTALYLDLAGYLKLPKPDYMSAQGIYYSLETAANKIVDAQNIIVGMLKQQAKR